VVVMAGLACSIACASGCGRIDFGDDLAGLTVRFSFDGPPTAGVDDSMSGLAGTCLGTCPTPVPGHHGQGYQFNGTTDCIDIPDHGQLDPERFTLAVWATQAHDGATAPALTHIAKQLGAGVNDSWELEAGPNFGEAFFTSDAPDFLMLYSPDHAVEADRWYHLAATWDGVTKRLYIDGVLSVEAAAPAPGAYDTSDAHIGCDSDNGSLSQYYAGILDEIELYDRALSADEIALLAAR
jgi:hypothetical protein